MAKAQIIYSPKSKKFSDKIKDFSAKEEIITKNIVPKSIISKSSFLEICVLMYRYQKRFWWQLSSFVQQTDFDKTNDFKIRVNIHKDDPFSEYTNRLKKTFDPLLNIEFVEWDSNDYFGRGTTRNRDLYESQSKWILFTDADMVFEPICFREIFKKLNEIKNHQNVIGADHYSTDKQKMNILLNEEKYNTTILNAYEKIKTIQPWVKKRAGAFGFFQIVDIENMKYKSYPTWKDDPISKTSVNKFKSDVVFRRKCGGCNIKFSNLFHIVHMTHYKTDFQELR